MQYELKNLTIADFHCVLNRIKGGDYGDMYNTVNPPKILEWFMSYFDERTNLIMEENSNKHKDNKESEWDDFAKRNSYKHFKKMHAGKIATMQKMNKK